ncbi:MULTISPECIES: NAD(P)H-dependent oxidoreductase [Acinetobacter]|uniref:NAD(P)H-dependent oxidoreductase n=1 Tax=Acinetobacter piscicola TaxID=2006115 RepID=A0A7S6VTM5_9GAMM|nr:MULTISPECIES: NAD(P)H-dependent oxidoreductase [Acinetobacter]MDM1757933.1 NAD(P)H-dependent oxidoreductase [Acinetobacter sp. 256-1]MDM1761348.1 NAD(P)H-dependent oxidoreductase [Acinetobacter sp. 251-1]QOW44710.1 NAD(P)H-dependent oxidoreductase [Acinetobacter piscicola]
MNILIIHAHPEPQSFCTALKNTAIEELQKQGHQIEVSDLYAMNFNPVASAADFAERGNADYLNYALEQRHACQQKVLAHDIQTEVEKVQKADLLILNFPMYWMSMPALLKGWIDRVFVSGIFYGGKRFYNHGGMTGKKAMLSFTLGGRDHMFGEGAIHGSMDNILIPIQRGTLAYVGYDVLPPFIAYHVPYISQEAREQILLDYRQHLHNIENLPAIVFPTLEQFDDKLYPLKNA